jgi:hypothetical protein
MLPYYLTKAGSEGNGKGMKYMCTLRKLAHWRPTFLSDLTKFNSCREKKPDLLTGTRKALYIVIFKITAK